MAIAVTIIVAAVIAAVDQVIKYFIYENLYPSGKVTVIENLFSLIYTENRGAAFGIFQDGTIFFIVLASFMLGVFFYLLLKKKFTSKLFYASAALMIGGGIGNLIDRIFRHFVIDYLSLSFFPPICNFADYCITVGAVLLVISIMFASDNKTEENGGSENDE